MANTNDILGYRVTIPCADGQFIEFDHSRNKNFLTEEEPSPISRGDAYRRLAAFLDDHPEFDHTDFVVQPVYRELQPIESGARELSGLLKSLCARHGIQLGLNDTQIEAQIERELQGYGAVKLPR